MHGDVSSERRKTCTHRQSRHRSVQRNEQRPRGQSALRQQRHECARIVVVRALRRSMMMMLMTIIGLSGKGNATSIQEQWNSQVWQKTDFRDKHFETQREYEQGGLCKANTKAANFENTPPPFRKYLPLPGNICMRWKYLPLT